MQVVRRSGLVYHSYSLDFGSLTAMLWNGLSDFKEWFKLLVLYYYTTSSLCLCILQCDQISTSAVLAGAAEAECCFSVVIQG